MDDEIANITRVIFFKHEGAENNEQQFLSVKRIQKLPFMNTCIEYFIFVLNQVYLNDIFVKFLETLKGEFYLSPTINTPLVLSA